MRDARAALPRAPSVLLFDLDGTLVDSAPDLARAANAALVPLGHRPVAERAVREWVGNGARTLLARCIAGSADATGVEPVALDRALAAFLTEYRANVCVDSRLYPGVRAGLDALATHGARLACVTNKPQAHAEALLEAIGLGARFEIVIGGDAVSHQKPHPEPLLKALEAFRAGAHEAVLVGDSSNDVAAARAAGIAVVCVSYGYNHGADIRDAAPDAVVDAFADVVDLLEHGNSTAMSP